MKIISYNVNGIRAAMNKGLADWMKEENADIYCFQETKATPEQVDLSVFEQLGYTGFWNNAEKKGYSGTAIFTKHKPVKTEIGFKDKNYNNEGRMVLCQFDEIAVASLYVPSGSSGDVRQDYKMQWLSFFHNYVNELKKTYKNLIICGDYNICHKPIDIHDPIGNKNSSGFLPEERDWMESFIQSGFVDTFRTFNQSPHEYSWWTFRANARNNNKGWRIDYCLASTSLEKKLANAGIMQQVKHSDHCPVWVELNL